MLQLKILNGRQAGTEWVARRFPFQIGRAPSASLRLEDDGVWDQHLRLEVRPAAGAVLVATADAFTAVNGHPVQEAILRNGDLIEIGSVQMQFGLSPATQHGLRLRETLTWTALGALGLGQVGLIYWLIA